MHQTGAAQGPRVGVGESERPAGRGREAGDRARVPEEVGRLEVHEIGDSHQRRVEPLAGEDDRQRRLGRDHGVPRRCGGEAGEDSLGVGLQQVRHRGVELPAPPLAGEGPGGLRPADAVRHLDELGRLREPRRDGHAFAAALPWPAAPVPALVGRRERFEDGRRKLQVLGERPRDRRVVLDHAVDLAMPRERELQAQAETVERRMPGPDREHARGRRAQAPQLVVVLRRLQRDVVAEPLRLLVGVGVAAHVDEQRGVVDGDALLLRQVLALGEPQRDQALAEDVLHRLPEAEVDAERERRDELSKPHVRAIGAGHWPSVSAPRR